MQTLYVQSATAEMLSLVELGLSHDSNIGLSSRDEDIRSDWIGEVYADYGYAWNLDDGHGFMLLGNAVISKQATHEKLDQFQAGLVIRYSKKFGIGTDRPRMDIFAGLDRDYSRSDIRDGWHYEAGASVSKTFRERWDGQLSVSYREQRPDHVPAAPSAAAMLGLRGDTFSIKQFAIAAELEYLINNFWSCSLGFNHTNGDLLSSTVPRADILLQADAAVADPALGNNYVAYRIDGSSNRIILAVTRAVTDNSSFSLNYERLFADGPEDIDYERNLIMFNLSYFF